MPVVRCPVCTTLRSDPPSAFACERCGHRLRWHIPPAGSQQLGRYQAQVRSHQDVMSAVTELFYENDVDREAMARVRQFFVGQAAGDLQEAAFGAAFMLATTLRILESTWPGLGEQMLHAMGLTLAGVGDDSPDP